MIRRIAATGTVAGLLSALVLGTAPSAHAAWRTQHSFHGAKVQLCKTPTGSGDRVKVRVDNRNGEHTHHGQLTRTRGKESKSVTVRASAGTVSSAKGLTIRSRDQISWGGGEEEGINFGDVALIGQLPAC